MADATADLIRALIDNMRGAPDDWASFAMVVSLSEGRIAGTSGYTYSPDGTVSAVASRPTAVMAALDAYLAGHYRPEDPRPVKLLVQFDRDLGRYEVTFEDADETRWKVTPENIETLPAQLRPQFA